MDRDKVQRYKDSLKYFEDLKNLREREDLDSLSDFFRSMTIRPTSKELEKPIAIDDNIESQLENTAGVGRELTEEELYQNLSQQQPEETTVEDFGGVTKAIEEAKQRTTEEPQVNLGTEIVTPTEQQIIDANTPRLGDEIDLVKKHESVGDDNYLQKGKTETENVEEDVKKNNLSGPDYQADVATFREKADEEKILSTGDETSRYYNNPSELYDGIKNNDDRIYNYLYQGISKKEWKDQKPIFDFVAISKKDKGKLTSSAFGPVQIVGNTVRDAMTRMKEGSEEYNFANRLQAAQNLFINLSNGYKKRGNFDANKAANTKKGEKALNILGISAKQFKEYVDDGYFLPSNQPNSKGLPPKILGDNYEKNYYKLFKNVLLNKASGDTTSLEETLQKYHGHPTDKNQNKTYQKEVFKNLNILTKQSGGMIESDPYKKQPRFI